MTVRVYNVRPAIFLTQTSEALDTSVALRAATLSLSGADPMTECVNCPLLPNVPIWEHQLKNDFKINKTIFLQKRTLLCVPGKY